ncbi:MAG TPA: hypothetical protein VF997_13530 [Polyangia bacterium]
MRNVLVTLVFGLSLIGCGGTGQPVQAGPGDVDMALSSSGGSGGGGGGGAGGGGGGGGGGVADMSHGSSTDMHGAGGDMASSDMAGLKPFGAPCTANAQCATMVCFIGGMQSFCSYHCTQATAAKDCPVPPTTGVCNNQGYCK